MFMDVYVQFQHLLAFQMGCILRSFIKLCLCFDVVYVMFSLSIFCSTMDWCDASCLWMCRFNISSKHLLWHHGFVVNLCDVYGLFVFVFLRVGWAPGLALVSPFA